MNDQAARGGDAEQPGPPAQLSPDAHQTGERRRHPRHRAGPGACLFRVASPGGLPLGRATPEDVSAGSALLLSPRLAPPGGAVVLEVLPPHPLAGRRLPFRVLRCEELADGGHLLAGMFDPRLAEQEARALAGASLTGGWQLLPVPLLWRQ